MKDVSSRFLIHARSSHPNSMKVNVLVNEGLRMLRNTSIHLGWEVARDHLQDFVRRMQFSGYDMPMKARVIQKIIRKYDEKLQRYAETKKMFRSRKDQYNERRTIKDKKKSGWYDKEKYDGVLFVDVTENSELMRDVQKACKKNKMKVKVVEKMKSTVKGELQRSNPFKFTKCGRTNCVLCRLNMNIDCRTRGCVYQMKCQKCTRKYRGQTSRSTYERTNEHFLDLLNEKEGSVLFEHFKQYHDGEQCEIEVTILSRCFGEPTTRLITEAVLINELTDDETLNSKSEWNYVSLPRVAIARQ